MILKEEEAWEQKHERNWDRKPTSERHQKLLLLGIDHCQAGLQAEDKAWLQGRVHIQLVPCYGIHIAVIGKQWDKRMQKMVPLLSLQAPWPATSLLPSLQSGIMTSTWHNVNALTLSFTFDDNLWVGLDFNKIMLPGANYTDKIQEWTKSLTLSFRSQSWLDLQILQCQLGHEFD